MRCDDGTLNPDGEYAAWHKVIDGASNSAGMMFDVEEHIRPCIEAACSTNIQEKLYKCPVGGWAKNPILKEAGKFCKLQIEWGMDKVSNLEFGRD